MKQLTKTETNQLASLLKRAIEHNQLELAVHSPFATEAEFKASGHPYNDRWDGNATNCAGELWTFLKTNPTMPWKLARMTAISLA